MPVTGDLGLEGEVVLALLAPRLQTAEVSRSQTQVTPEKGLVGPKKRKEDTDKVIRVETREGGVALTPLVHAPETPSKTGRRLV